MLVCFRNCDTDELVFDIEEKSLLPRVGDSVTLGLYAKRRYTVTDIHFNYSGRKLARITIYVDGPYDFAGKEHSASRAVSLQERLKESPTRV